ncbi:MAG: hypothetical protein WCT77_08975, partial [Bacteroidota bacterium]
IISNSQNVTGNNLEGFINHRYDQSVLSLLVFKHKINLFCDPTQYGNFRGQDTFGQILLHTREKGSPLNYFIRKNLKKILRKL